MPSGRSVRDLVGDSGMGDPGIVGVRVTPGYSPTPNSEPAGSLTGAPIRTRLASMPISPGADPVRIVPGERENRVAIVTAPLVNYTIYVGDAGVNTRNGMALVPGVATEIIVPGFQEFYAVTDAPVLLRLQIQIAAILLAERERRA